LDVKSKRVMLIPLPKQSYLPKKQNHAPNSHNLLY